MNKVTVRGKAKDIIIEGKALLLMIAGALCIGYGGGMLASMMIHLVGAFTPMMVGAWGLLVMLLGMVILRWARTNK